MPLSRTLATAFLLALALAAPANAALAPAPTYIDFEGNIGSNPTIQRTSFSGTNVDCAASVSPTGGNGGGQYLFVTNLCGPPVIRFTLPQLASEVSVYGLVDDPPPPGLTALGGPPFDLRMTLFDSTGQPLRTVDKPTPIQTWTPFTVTTDDGKATIARVQLETGHTFIGLDDVGFSPAPQPDVEITGGPSGTVPTGDATFTFAGNQTGMSLFCKLDDNPSAACTSPVTLRDLPDGPHRFQVIGTDRWRVSATNERSWTVSRPPPDRDGDGVPDTADNCPDNANADQGDADKDGVGDACEILPAGNRPIQAGVDAKVRVVSGEVFIKLPPGATGSAFTASLRVPFQDSGFLPLKGVATIPTGSTIDTRAGEVAVTAALNGQRPTSRRQLRREARFRAGIFAIRQARYRKGKRKRRIPVRAELTSAPGAERPCQAGRGGPPKGTTVRSLVTVAKGVFRTVGGAATAAPAKGRSATFNTTDRCDGTVTSVGRGKVAVIARKSGKTTTVRAGRAFIVRARLFAAKKGRRG